MAHGGLVVGLFFDIECLLHILFAMHKLNFDVEFPRNMFGSMLRAVNRPVLTAGTPLGNH